MKKQKETRMVLKEVDKGWIKGYGINIWLRRLWWQVVVWVGVWVAIMFAIMLSQENNIVDLIIIGGVGYFIIVLPLCFKLDRVGSQYWNEIKDKEQPILLKPMSSWRRKKEE